MEGISDRKRNGRRRWIREDDKAGREKGVVGASTFVDRELLHFHCRSSTMYRLSRHGTG